MSTAFWANKEGELRRLWRDGYPMRVLADYFGASLQSTYSACHRLGLRRGRGWLPPEGRATGLPPMSPARQLSARIEALRTDGVLRAWVGFDLECDIVIASSGGAYTALAELAAARGIPQARLLARWHMMRPHLGGYRAAS